jgi:hypothetical protein
VKVLAVVPQLYGPGLTACLFCGTFPVKHIAFHAPRFMALPGLGGVLFLLHAAPYATGLTVEDSLNWSKYSIG